MSILKHGAYHVEKAFEPKIDKTSHWNGCWIWLGHRNEGGYGLFHYKGKQYRAHRVSYELYNGKIGRVKDCVCHKCDNPGCVNPDHLFLGTNQDNMQDMLDKRQARLDRIQDISGEKQIPLYIAALVYEWELEEEKRTKEIAKRDGLKWEEVKDELWAKFATRQQQREAEEALRRAWEGTTGTPFESVFRKR